MKQQSYKGHRFTGTDCEAKPAEVGLHLDEGKNPLDLVPEELIEAVAGILQFGAKKYAVHNWRKGIDYNRIYGSILRHLTSWHKVETLDPESKLPHLHHAACNLAFLITYETHSKYEKFDNRYKYGD